MITRRSTRSGRRWAQREPDGAPVVDDEADPVDPAVLEEAPPASGVARERVVDRRRACRCGRSRAGRAPARRCARGTGSPVVAGGRARRGRTGRGRTARRRAPARCARRRAARRCDPVCSDTVGHAGARGYRGARCAPCCWERRSSTWSASAPWPRSREADAFVPHFGGAMANVAVTAARRGARRRAGRRRRATTPGARWLRERLAAEGVDLTGSTLVARPAPTPVAFVTVDARGEPRFLDLRRRPAPRSSRAGRPAAEAVEACDALFFSSNTLVGRATSARLTLAARDARAGRGKPVVLDPNLRLERWRPRRRAVEVVARVRARRVPGQVQRARGAALTGEQDAEAAAASLLAAGAQHVVVTLGADGALLRGGGLDATCRASPARPVDATGRRATRSPACCSPRLARTGFYPAALAAMLPDAVAEAARATERWGAVASTAARGSRARRRARVRAVRDAAARRLRRPDRAAARRPAGRARPHRPVAVDQRPQPRRRLPAPARALRRRGRRSATRRSPRSRRRSGPGGISKVKSRRIQADPARDRGDHRVDGLDLAWMRDAPVPEARATSCARCPASGARPPRACCCSPTGCATCRSTRTSRASGCACACCARARRSRAARRDARPDAARRGARAPRQPAAPRPAHLPCAARRAAACACCGACARRSGARRGPARIVAHHLASRARTCGAHDPAPPACDRRVATPASPDLYARVG